jgi:hypothetical protein
MEKEMDLRLFLNWWHRIRFRRAVRRWYLSQKAPKFFGRIRNNADLGKPVIWKVGR